jgi:hypothetical protein
MVSREVPLSLLSGIGFKLTNKDKKTWAMSARAEDCIPKEMATRGLRDGRVKSQEMAGSGTLYTFTFSPAEKPTVKHVYTMSYLGGEVYAEVDTTHIEESKLPSEAGKSTEDIGEARLDKFFAALKGCQKNYGFRAFVKPAPFAEPAPAAPAAPAAAGAPPPGWGGEPAAPNRYGDLEEMMRKMGIREGGRRRTKKRNSTRRRLSKKKRFT